MMSFVYNWEHMKKDLDLQGLEFQLYSLSYTYIALPAIP